MRSRRSLWAARTYVRISDNKRRCLKAEETKQGEEKGGGRRCPPGRARSIPGVRKCLMNGRQSVSLFERTAMTDPHLRVGGTPADRRQWNESSGEKDWKGFVRTCGRLSGSMASVRRRRLRYLVSTGLCHKQVFAFDIA